MSMSKPKDSIWLCIPVRYITDAVIGVMSKHGNDEAKAFAEYAFRRARDHRRHNPYYEQQTFL